MKKALRSRGVRIVLFTGGIVALLGYVGWRAMQPKFKFASEAEVRALVDPRLLRPLERDAAAEERYARFHEVLTVKGPWTAPRTAKLLAIAREGRIQAEPAKSPWGELSFPNTASLKNLIKERAAFARVQAGSRPSEAARTLIESIEMSDCFLGGSSSQISLLVAKVTEGFIDAATWDLTPKLDDRLLGLLLNALEKRTDLAPLWKSVTVREFQEQFLPILPDLLIRKQERLPESGTYDALQTSALMSAKHAAVLDGIDKSLASTPLPIDLEVEKFVKSVPEDDSELMDPGLEKSARHLWYVLRVNNHPNSMGSWIMGLEAKPSLEILAKWRTERDMLLAFLRAEIYRRKRGRLPDTLAEVGGGTDHYTKQALRYDPKRRLIWSVGKDLTYDGGAVSGNWAPKDADYGLVLPKA